MPDLFAIKKYDEDQFGGARIPDSWAKSRNDVTYWEPDESVPHLQSRWKAPSTSGCAAGKGWTGDAS